MRLTTLLTASCALCLPGPPLYAGDWTLGLGAHAERLAYRDAETTLSPVPYIQYQGARFGLQNDSLSWRLGADATTRWQWVLDYRATGHSDSPALDALAREGSWETGLAVDHDLGVDTQLSASVQADSEAVHRGYRVTLDLEHTVERGNLDLSLVAGATYRSQRLAQHRFGVSANEATTTLGTHTARAAWTPALEGRIVLHRPRNTAWAFQLSVTDLSAYRDSPLLARNQTLDAVLIWLKQF